MSLFNPGIYRKAARKTEKLRKDPLKRDPIPR
jgi:hypothetical protein